MDVKIRHKLIEIEDRVSDRFVILVTNYRWLFAITMLFSFPDEVTLLVLV